MKNRGVIPKRSKYFSKLYRETNSAPEKLYYWGDRRSMLMKKLAIVGTREATYYGKSEARRLVKFCRSLSVVTVSGLAFGIDSCVHEASIELGVPTIAVIPSNLENITPRSNYDLACRIVENGGLILSERNASEEYGKHWYPLRNRIIAGIADATAIVEAGKGSGSLITANYAKDYDRPIYVCVGDVYSSKMQGNLDLVDQNKAEILTYTYTKLMDDLEGTQKSNEISSHRYFQRLQGMGLSDVEQMVIKAVNAGSHTVESVKDRLEELDIDMEENLSSILAKLTLSGLISRDEFGNLYLNI